MQSQKEPKRRAWPRIVSVLIVVIILVPLLLPLFLLLLVTHLLYGVVLQLVIWACWCTRGVNVLLVYSDSPNWHDYIENNLVPKLPRSTVLLNWSRRRKWRFLSLRVMAFQYFGGSREFNPLVVVFRPFRWAKTYRFWKPFKDYKHGKTRSLETLGLVRQLLTAN